MGVGVMGAMTLWDHGSNVCQLNAKGHLMMLSVGGGMMVHDHPFVRLGANFELLCGCQAT